MTVEKTAGASSKKKSSRIGRPSRDESQRRSENLLNTAAAIFASRGYSQTSLDRIAAEAGLSKRTIYTWYGGKAELFDAVMFHLLGNLAVPEERGNESYKTNGIEELETQVANIIEATLQPSFLGIHRIFLREVDQFPEVLMTFQESTEERSYALLASVLNHYPEFQQLTMPVEQVAKAILGLIHSQVVLTSLNVKSPEEVSASQEAKRIVGIVMHGCLAR